jgi:hypothetical protein
MTVFHPSWRFAIQAGRSADSSERLKPTHSGRSTLRKSEFRTVSWDKGVLPGIGASNVAPFLTSFASARTIGQDRQAAAECPEVKNLISS